MFENLPCASECQVDCEKEMKFEESSESESPLIICDLDQFKTDELGKPNSGK